MLGSRARVPLELSPLGHLSSQVTMLKHPYQREQLRSLNLYIQCPGQHEYFYPTQCLVPSIIFRTSFKMFAKMVAVNINKKKSVELKIINSCYKANHKQVKPRNHSATEIHFHLVISKEIRLRFENWNYPLLTNVLSFAIQWLCLRGTNKQASF